MSSFEVVLIFVVILVVWFAQYHWKRRKLYYLAGKIPGPRSFPFIGSAHLFLGSKHDMFKTSMNIFDYSPGLVKLWFGKYISYWTYDPKYLEIILNSPKCLGKERSYFFGKPIVGTGLFIAPVPLWKIHRKLMMPTLNQRVLDGFVKIFAEQSEIMVQILEQFAGKGEFDILHVSANCTLDIICETAMGVKINAQTTNSEFFVWLERLLEIIFCRASTFFYHPDFIFDLTPMKREQTKLSRKMREFTSSIVTKKCDEYKQKRKRLKEGFLEEDSEEGTGNRKSLLDLMIELSSEGRGFTDTELMDEAQSFIAAGSDTTAATTCFIFTVLGLYPEIQQNVYEEVMEVVGPSRSLEYTDLPYLKYMERVIKETFRVFPIAPFIGRQLDGTLKLDDHVLTEGSSIIIGIINLHMNPKYWPNPWKFDPDRFLPEEVRKRQPYTYLPFSGGPRNCIGQRLAMMELKSITATAIKKYKFFTKYKSLEEIRLQMYGVLRPTDGFKIYIEPRT